MDFLKNTIDFAKKHFLNMIFNILIFFFGFIAIAVFLIRFFDLSFGLGGAEAFHTRPNLYLKLQTFSLLFWQIAYAFKLQCEWVKLEKLKSISDG